MNLEFKHLLKQVVPPFVTDAIKRCLKLLRHYYSGGEASKLAAVNSLKVAHEHLNAGVSICEIVLRDKLRFKIHPESIEPFLAFCYLYPAMVEEMDAFLRLTAGRRRLLDVGALHGVFSLAFAGSEPARQVVAVDASPIAFARLLYNVHHNAEGKVTPVECALSSQNGIVQMHYEWEHAVVAGADEAGAAGALSVISKRGDDLCGSLSFAPDVIKIDVEGHEIKVLKGLEHIILASQPMIFLEIHPGRIRQEQDTLESLVSMFERWNYEAVHFDGRLAGSKEICGLVSDERLVLRPVTTEQRN